MRHIEHYFCALDNVMVAPDLISRIDFSRACAWRISVTARKTEVADGLCMIVLSEDIFNCL